MQDRSLNSPFRHNANGGAADTSWGIATPSPSGLASDLTPSVRANIETARLFQELRHVLDLSAHDVAARIATTPDIVDALETGRITGLPAWPETARIVTAYTGLAGIDPRPVLHLLKEQLATMPQMVSALSEPDVMNVAPTVPTDIARSHIATDSAAYTSTTTTEPQSTVIEPAPTKIWSLPGRLFKRPEFAQRLGARVAALYAGTDAPPADATHVEADQSPDSEPRFRWLTKSASKYLAALFRPHSLVMLIPLVAVVLPATNSNVLSATTAIAPAPLASALRDLHMFILLRTGTRRDGLLWLDVSNPDALRGDKLKVRDR